MLKGAGPDFDYQLVEALLETESGFGGILPRNISATRQLEAMEKHDLAVRNAKGSWNATSKLRREWNER